MEISRVERKIEEEKMKSGSSDRQSNSEKNYMYPRMREKVLEIRAGKRG